MNALVDYAKLKLAGIGVAGMVIIILVFAFFMKDCGEPDEPKIPPAVQHTIDSLKETNAAFEHRKDSIITIVTHDTVHADATNQSAEKSKAAAAVVGRRADSLAAIAKMHQDSALLWHAAYDARTSERDTLLVTVAKKDSVIQDEHDARIGLSILYAADTTRRIAIDKVNSDLEKAIGKLQQPCKILGPIPCPSRTVTGVLSATLGVLAGHAIK